MTSDVLVKEQGAICVQPIVTTYMKGQPAVYPEGNTIVRSNKQDNLRSSDW